MNLPCRAKKILEPAPAIGRSTFRTLTLVASVGLLISCGSVASATTSPAVAINQEHDDDKGHDVKVHNHSDSDGEIEVIVVRDGDPIDRELIKKLNSEHLGQLHELAADADGNVEVVVIQDGDSKGHHGMLKKLKSDLKGQLHEIISDADENIEVIVVDESDTKHHALLKKLNATHKGHLHKRHADSDRHRNVFVFKDDDKEGDVKMDIHGHLADLLHGQKSGKLNHQALAKKLRQLADRLEAKNNEPHSAHKTHGKIEIHPSGEHTFHLEKRGNSEKANHREFEFTTDAGQHIVIGKPGQTGTMVIDLKQDGGGKLHSLDGDQKKIIWHAKEHDAVHNVVVERLHLDEDHNTRVHESHASEGKTSDEGLDASIRDLKNELKELRLELKELRSDRKRD